MSAWIYDILAEYILKAVCLIKVDISVQDYDILLGIFVKQTELTTILS